MERNYGEGETMVQYLQRVDENVRALEELDYTVDEKEIIYTALQGLDQAANEALLQYLHLEQQKWTKVWIWEVLISDEARKVDAGRGLEGVPNVSMARVWGCMAQYKVPDQQRRKLDPKAQWGIFLGVSERSKAWVLWSVADQRVMESRDVVFHEGLNFKGWKEHGTSQTSHAGRCA
ncbi:hypothetical protein CLOM_g17572 [Closterium sp. NIES-68]|nr:hypothetical protein CLOM_g17572 [Closterium sp. NIES-68]